MKSSQASQDQPTEQRSVSYGRSSINVKFENRILELEKYKKKFGNCNVPYDNIQKGTKTHTNLSK